jgi:hypothetical protein
MDDASEDPVKDSERQMEAGVEDLEERTEKLGERIEDVRSDWEEKKADTTLATGPPAEEDDSGRPREDDQSGLDAQVPAAESAQED